MSFQIKLLFCIIALTFVIVKLFLFSDKIKKIIAFIWVIYFSYITINYTQLKPIFEYVKSDNLTASKKILIKNPKLVHKKSFFGNSVIHIAVESASNNMIILLINSGANVNDKGDSDQTPLHIAAFRGDTQIVKTLIAKDAELNSRAYRLEETPLHLAAKKNHAEIVKLLLAYGANPDLTDFKGKTSLDVAIENHAESAIEILENYSSPGSVSE